MRKRLNNRKLKPQILKLRAEGKTYNQIAKELDCSKSVISYHCGNGSEKERVLSALKKRPILYSKISRFKGRCTRSDYKKIQSKIKTFKRSTKNSACSSTIVNSINKNYTYKDVLNKIGDNPVCYLTGTPIDLNKPETYQLDHIIPTSKGGSNDLDNLQICIKEANTAKGDLMVDELYELCEKILKYKDIKKE